MGGILYLVSTPIGNLEDVTLRALRTLKEVSLIAAEDTRHTKKLLNHYQIHTPLTSYFEHNKIIKGEYLRKLLAEGKNIALVTDAGTPGISDPGEDIVRQCIADGVKIESIPGPSAFVAALSISGLPASGFSFHGFLPRKTKEKKEVLEKISGGAETLIFYESPHRVKDTLKIMSEIFGPRQAVIVRELTKVYEEIIRGNLDELNKLSITLKGEFCIIVAGEKEKPEISLTEEQIKDLVSQLQAKGLSLKNAVKSIASGYNLPSRKVYGLMIKDYG